MAERMHTSRTQIGRLLDPTNGNVTLSTLQRAAELLGRKVRLELVLTGGFRQTLISCWVAGTLSGRVLGDGRA